MKMRPLHWFGPLFLLLIFLGSKSLEYHTVSHLDGDPANCEWCDFALLLHSTPFEPAPEIVSEIPPAFEYPVRYGSSYDCSYLSAALYFRNYGRPPPHLS